MTLGPRLGSRTPDLGALDLFVSVLELGSVSKAAVAHGVAQPSASTRLRSLERRLGVRLLERASTGSWPTEAGALVGDWAREVLAAAGRFDGAVAALRTSEGRRLRIAGSYTIAEYLLPAWLARFRAAHADVACELDVVNSTRVAERVLAGEVDLGFVEGPAVAKGLAARTVGGDELVVVVEPAHPWARRRRPLRASDLVSTRLVVREEGSGTREALDRALFAHRHGGEPPPLLALGSTTAVKAAVTNGAGPGVLSRLAVEGELAGGALVAVAVSGLDLHRRLRAVWARDRRLPGPALDLLACAARRRE